MHAHFRDKILNYSSRFCRYLLTNARQPPDKVYLFQIFFFIASRAFVIVSVSSETLLWKGIWELLDMLRLISSYMTSVYIFIGLVVVLFATKSFNVSHCSPLGKGYSYDIDGEYLKIATVLQLRQKASFWLHLLDAFLTVVLNLMTASVYHWYQMPSYPWRHEKSPKFKKIRLRVVLTDCPRR